MSRIFRYFVAVLAAVTLFTLCAMGQPPAAAPGAQASAPAAAPRPGGGGGFSQPGPSDWNDHEGWKQIFNGQSLEGWNCDQNIWSVADGAIVAKSTAEKPTGTTYCTWKGGKPADFELKAEFRMLVGGNSGIQYRSGGQPPRTPGTGGAGGQRPPGAGQGAPAAAAAPAPPATALQAAQPCQMQTPVLLPVQGRMGGFGGPGGGGGQRAPGAGRQGGPRQPSPYDVGGYQYDFDYQGNYPGNLYENGMAQGAPTGTSNRGIITYKGQVVHLLPDAKKETLGCIGDATDLKGVMNINGWNYIHIIARGPVLLHMLNGRLITATIDDDPVRFKKDGEIAVQIEGLGEVYFRNLWLKTW